jgi:alanine-synthesizing transaminase
VSSLYSRRLSWSSPPNRFSTALSALKQAGAPLFDLTISNPTAADLVYPHAEIAQALGGIGTFSYEPDPAGRLEARRAIAAYYASRNISVAPERILLTASTSEAYAFLFKLLCDPGDEVLIPLPSYPLFSYLASLESVRTVPYRLRYDGSWHIDFSTIEAAISDRTRAIIVVSPNNPTGSFLSSEEAARLMDVACRCRLPVIADEVFFDYPLARSGTPGESLINRSETLTFCLNGLSKSAGMPQMKLGWVVLSGPGEQVEDSRKRLELILDTYLSPSTPVQRALPKLLEIGHDLQSQIQNRIRRNLDVLESALKGSPAGVLHAEAGWSAILQVPRTRSDEEWALALLRERHVVVQPGYFYDLPGGAFLVVSLLTAPHVLQEGIARLRAAASQT